MRLSANLAWALSGLLLLACDGGGPSADPAVEPPVENETPTDETPTDETPTDETPTDPTPTDPAPTDPTPGVDTVAYPEGPFGTGYLDITRDLEFFDPWTGATPRLSDYYQNPDVSVLIVSSAAGWCTACMYEGWDLVEVYDKYKSRGLEVLYTLYEDQNGDPIFQDGDSDDEITADLTFFQAWKETLGKYIGLPTRVANYPVLVDRDFVLEPYYNEGATPLTLIVRTSDMRILYRQVGYAAGTIEQLVKGHVD